MARCDREYSCVRRVADRGNVRGGPDSHARGKDRHLTRRIADRGSGRVGTDSRDFEIKRLRQRVRDLEEIKQLRQRVRDLEKIRRLRQRVRDLELQKEMSKKETESVTFVWDEAGEEEEHLSCYFHTRFYEPTYSEGELQDEPKFDEDAVEPRFDENGSDFDEEEYLWVHQGDNGVLNREEEEKENENHKPSKVSPGIFAAIFKDDAVANGGATVVTSDTMMVNGGVTGDDESGLKFRINKPTITGKLMMSPLNKGSAIKNIEIQMGKDFKFDGLIPVFMDKYLLPEMNDLMPPMHEDSTRGSHIANKILHVEMKINSKSVGLFEKNGFLHGHVYDAYTGSTLVLFNHLGDHTNSCEKPVTRKSQVEVELFEQVKSIVNRRRSSLPFDPGGTSLESTEMIREVGQFGQVVIIVQKNRVDVPFDPGGRGLGSSCSAYENSRTSFSKMGV